MENVKKNKLSEKNQSGCLPKNGFFKPVFTNKM